VNNNDWKYIGIDFAKIDPYEKCYECRFYDVDKSTSDWIVCFAPMPVDVMLAKSSKDCDKYQAGL